MSCRGDTDRERREGPSLRLSQRMQFAAALSIASGPCSVAIDKQLHEACVAAFNSGKEWPHAQWHRLFLFNATRQPTDSCATFG
jgi:hypothetical protein